MYKLKSIAQRSTTLGAAIALAVGAVLPAFLPATAAYADALNPLTKRSLTLSSSSPGWSYTDGSGNSTYAPPNSGANGKQTGNTFAFHVSSDSQTTPIKTISFQYCTTSAGTCTSPGDDATHGVDDSGHADLKVVTSTPKEVADTTDGVTGSFGDFVDTTSGAVTTVPNRNGTQGNYVVYWNDSGTWKQSTGWSMSTDTVEDTGGSLDPTGQQNYIILTSGTGLGIPADTEVKVVFFGTDANYIQNPGHGAFFVKINTYNKEFGDGSGGTVTISGLEPAEDDNVIDGGVTVANVMNQSIQITTKVLETMQFSVGTVDPDTLSSTDAADDDSQSTFEAAENIAAPGDVNHAKHGTCNPVLMQMDPSANMANVLQLGDQNAESSLSTDHTYATHSYWRLSSNSSAGASVYYSGHTLSNTEGDEITAIGDTKDVSRVGSEQFGLAIDAVAVTGADTGGTWDDATYGVDYSQDRATDKNYENAADNGILAVDDSTLTDLGAINTPPWDYTALNDSFHMPKLDPLHPDPNYGSGAGKINNDGQGTSNAQFAFNTVSDTIPVELATEADQVVDCVTAKMRYIANIAATTPAGIYTTKVNYIASPQY